MQTQPAFNEAVTAILAGQAKPHALWVLLSSAEARDGYALRPLQWEGPGEYQWVSFADGRDGFVRVPDFSYSLQWVVKQATRRAAVQPSH